MFSITSSPTNTEYMEFSIKKCGCVTEWLHSMEVGQQITIRGPYGNAFPVDTAFAGTDILVQRDQEVQMAANSFGNVRSVYISGLPYSFENSRILHRAILWAAHGEALLHKWFSTNYRVEVHAFVANGKYCVVNNTYVPQDTVVYTDKDSFELHLDANEIRWYTL